MEGPRRRDVRESLDVPGQDARELRLLLGDLRRVNRRYGGVRLVLRHLQRILPPRCDRPLTLLDVAAGGADVTRAAARWAAERRIALRCVALDRHPEMLAAAREQTGPGEALAFVRADALALPFGDHSVDVVICGMALHHFSPADAVRVLREIDRVARRGFVVNDLVRSWPLYVAAWIDSRLLARSQLARRDAPTSALRA
ncbi:MAG TPA: methyltransferase domain-containing protein, partial [bacterium]|nr:methyltransferase domain-containing protein [bacterium]